MTDYAYTGKKGTGKSKNIIRVARDTYFAEGRMVATNLDIYLEPMFGVQSKKTYIRVPDKPNDFDLLAAGHGNTDSYNEDKNGMLALDEMGVWFNTRSFADKGRAAVLEYLAHARKHGWDCFYIMQNVAQVDKQLRESFVEYVVRHTRFDKVKIPFVGGILCALFGKKAGYFPRFHTAVARLGCNPQDLKTDSAMFTGKDIEACYDTRQIFTTGYPHGTYTVLSPWHLKGRFEPVPPLGFWARLVAGFKEKKKPFVPRPSRISVPPGYADALAHAVTLPAEDRIAYMRLNT
jgi:hypothetical protein